MIAVVLGVLGALAVGVGAGIAGYRTWAAGRVDTAEARAAKLLAEAQREAEMTTRQSLKEVKDVISGMRREAEEDLRQRRQEVKRLEDRLLKRPSRPPMEPGTQELLTAHFAPDVERLGAVLGRVPWTRYGAEPARTPESG